jgi:hypothetical protein
VGGLIQQGLSPRRLWAIELDSAMMAAIFVEALMEFGGAFSEIVFAVTDWSPEQRFIVPLQHVFAAAE